MSVLTVRNARRLSQVVFCLLFFFLLLLTRFTGSSGQEEDLNQLDYPVRVFLEIDPLHALSQIFAGGSLHPALALCLLVLVPTFLLGRVFCGWVCPLGSINHLLSCTPKSARAWLPYGAGQKWKYYLLVLILAASLGGLHMAGWLDPLSLLIRSLTVSIFPSLAALIGGERVFLYGAVSGLLFVAILLLNRARGRFYCRYLCPLGALLGVCAKTSLLRLSRRPQGEKSGGLYCPMGADPGGLWRPAECVACFNCHNVYVKGTLRFSFLADKPVATGGIDLERRRMLGCLAGGLALGPMLQAGQLSAQKGGAKDARLIRPPGACAERKFLERCLRCGECMKICPTNALHPALGEGGVAAAFTPLLVPSIGYCQYSCTLCGQVCPTEAIERISLAEKKEYPNKGGIKIGTAFFDRGRCLPWAMGTPCIVCEEHCPMPEKAIYFEEVVTAKGTIKRPYVNPAICNGCGICENVCPVSGDRGIYVTSADESRDKANRMLLMARQKSKSSKQSK